MGSLVEDMVDDSSDGSDEAIHCENSSYKIDFFELMFLFLSCILVLVV